MMERPPAGFGQLIILVQRVGPYRYQGRADDIDGTATGQVSGNVLSWSYDIVLSMSGQLQVS